MTGYWEDGTAYTYPVLVTQARSLWKSCSSNEDCNGGSSSDDTYVCADHMWSYNGQSESATGCWEKGVCSNGGAFWMFDGRAIQWFCDTYSTYSSNGLEAPYGLVRADEPHFDAFVPGC
jgi:hypothetical protein